MTTTYVGSDDPASSGNRVPAYDAVRRCAEKGCRSAAMPRKGTRGPEPKRCEEHTKARIRELKSSPLNPRGDYLPCCRDHQDAGGSGKCQQCKDFREEMRDQATRELNERIVSGLMAMFDAEIENIGFQIVTPAKPKGWNTDRGPFEGRTRPEVFNADPLRIDHAEAWYSANRRWWDYPYDDENELAPAA